MKHFIFSVLFLGSFNVTAAEVGPGSTGGGPAVVCRDINKKIISAEFYDLYEGKVLEGYQINYSTASPRDQVMKAIERITFNEFYRTVLMEAIADMLGRFSFLPPGVVMKVSSDLGDEDGIVIPDGCDIEAVGFYNEKGKLRVAQPIFEKLSNTDRATFVLHEAIYMLARETAGAKTSKRSRNLNAALFADVGPDQLQDFMKGLLYSEKSPYGFRQAQRFVVVPRAPSQTTFGFQVHPDSNRIHYVYGECQKKWAWSDEAWEKAWENGPIWGKPLPPGFQGFHGTGPSLVSVADQGCHQLSVRMSWHYGEMGHDGTLGPITLNYDVSIGSDLIFSGSNKDEFGAGGSLIINLAHVVDLPEVPTIP